MIFASLEPWGLVMGTEEEVGSRKEGFGSISGGPAPRVRLEPWAGVLALPVDSIHPDPNL